MKFLSVWVFVLFYTTAFGQEIYNLSNNNSQLLNTNTSFAGLNKGIRVQGSYYVLWPSTSSQSANNFNSVDIYLPKLKSGFVMSNTNYSQADYYYYNTINLGYAQHFDLKNKLKIIPSIEVGAINIKLKTTNLFFGYPVGVVPQWQGQPLPAVINKRNFSFTSSILINYKNLYSGLSVQNINQPDIGLFGPYKTQRRYNIHTSYSFNFAEQHLLQLFGRFSKQGNFQNAQIMANGILFQKFIVGTGLTTGENIIATSGYRHTRFSFTYSYIVTVSKLSGNKAGSHELAATFSFVKKEKRNTLSLFENY